MHWSVSVVSLLVAAGSLGCGPRRVAPAAAPPAPAVSGAAGRASAGPEIFLAPLRRTAGRLSVGTPTNVSTHPGYDNQPSFVPDGGALLYTSVREGEHSDIYRYDLATHRTTPVTRTPATSEYSATAIPGRAAISVVRVEEDSAQRLWEFPLDGGAPSLVLGRLKPVGYHAWGDDHTLALFVLGRPSTLQLADTRTGRADTVATAIGRSLHRVPGTHRISFVDKSDSVAWTIKTLDLDTRAVAVVAPTLRGSEDYAWTPDGTIVMGQGSKLYALHPGAGATWMEIADLSSAGLRAITRLAVDPAGNWIAIVAEM